MIQLTTTAKARVLIVGEGRLVDEIARNLTSHGINQISIIASPEKPQEQTKCEVIDQNAEHFLAADSNYLRSFDLVLCADQPRSFELALAHLRWPDLPIIIMRGVGNNCKMRCQYEELPLKNGEKATFITLETDLLPWTDAKRTLVHSIVENNFHPQQDLPFCDYLVAAHAAITFQEVSGRWPSATEPEDKTHIQGMIPATAQKSELVNQYIDGFVRDGLTSAHETIAVLARFVVHDAINLLTGDGQPVNNTNLDEVIKIAVNGL